MYGASPSASEPSAGRGGRRRDRLTTPDGSPGPPKLTLQSVQCEKICSQCEKASSRPCAPDRPSAALLATQPENHAVSWSATAAALAVVSFGMVHGLYEWIWNGSDAFPDFLTWLLARTTERFAHGADLEQTALDGEARRGRADGSGMTGVDVLVGSAAAERARSPPIDRGLRLSMPLSVKSGPSCSQSGDDVDGRTGRTAACESCLVIRTQRPVSVGSPIGRSRPSFGAPCIGYRTGHSGPCSGTSPRP